MKLKSIYTYPIKSLSGISLEQSYTEERGLIYDRRWMLVDDGGRFITQREVQLMADLKCRIENEELKVSSKTRPHLVHHIPLRKITDPSRIDIQIWNSNLKAVHLGTEHDNFFSESLEKSCRLVFMDSVSKRNSNRLVTGQPNEVSFADGYPYLIISQASFDDLNGRLKDPVGMNRFRPNLVLEGCGPYEEDTMKEVRIGNIRFRILKQCARCILTTVDPQTYLKGKEPLATLAAYRTVNNQVMFGVNAIALDKGEINVNDPVEILS